VVGGGEEKELEKVRELRGNWAPGSVDDLTTLSLSAQKKVSLVRKEKNRET